MDDKTRKAKNILLDAPLPPLEPQENYLELSFPPWYNSVCTELDSISKFMKKMAECA